MHKKVRCHEKSKKGISQKIFCCSIVLLTEGWNKILGQENAVKARNVVFDIMPKLTKYITFLYFRLA